MEQVRPRISCLTPDQCARVHDHSLKILADTGIRVDSSAARTRFVESGCRCLTDNRVLIPSDRIQWAIDKAPMTT
ncbi:MAG: trimethylamine methyltransferase family protein [Desulfosarcina sp.]|jgi:trimethylamine:corrinoid methyltransferase-like protein